jgi:hypothetical protein
MNSIVTSRYGRLALFAAFVTINSAFGVAAAPSATGDQEAVWQLEHSYWEYVKALDVNGYKSLWHEDFVGWPSTAPMPMRKDHITDWLEEDRAVQDTLRCYKLEPAGFTSVGDSRHALSPHRTLGRQKRQRQASHNKGYPHLAQNQRHLADHRRHGCGGADRARVPVTI